MPLIPDTNYEDIPGNVEAMAFVAMVDAADDANEEYETEHGDAGDNYLQLVGEDKRKMFANVANHATTKHSATVEEAKRIAAKYDRFALEAKPCHRFTSFDAESIGGMLAGGPWMVEEIESQHDVSRYAEELQTTDADVRELVCSHIADRELCIRYHGDNFQTFTTYRCTDRGWYALLPDSWFVDALEEVRVEIVEEREELERQEEEKQTILAWWNGTQNEFMHATAEELEAGELGDEEEVSAPGWYSRLSAPGYMDCTEWCGPFETEWEAMVGLYEAYCE